jgi:hypothetical protein
MTHDSREEIAELRQAVIDVVGEMEKMRLVFANVPRGTKLRPERGFGSLVELCFWLNSIPENTRGLKEIVKRLEQSKGVQ